MEAMSGAEAVAGLPQAATAARAAERASRWALAATKLKVSFGKTEVLKGVSLSWERNTVSSMIGPSGCGKTTFLRTLNRMTELTSTAKVEGEILLDGVDVLEQPAHEVRRRVGMVFQRPNPFPMSIFENVGYALRNQGSRWPRKKALEEPVESALRRAGLWDEVKDDLDRSAYRLSGGQQQRLCIARVLASNPEVILMDEPCASLDPRSTAKIEELILELRPDYTMIVVTHNLAQAARISDQVAFMLMGELIEAGNAETIMTQPSRQETIDFIAGVFG